MSTRLIRVGHSPDPDDAFMFYALIKGKVSLAGLEFKEVVEPIEDLNRRALQGELEMTALSAHAYAKCAHQYWILSAGASLGRGYGPILVARAPNGSGCTLSLTASPDGAVSGLAGRLVALPGELTTAALVARLILPAVQYTYHPFDVIPEAVRSGQVDAGVLIHEGQLTYASQGLVKLLDFGEWWAQDTRGLPLPLGLDAVRSDLGEDTACALNQVLKDSIRYAFAHVDDALAYAQGFGRGISADVNSRFVRMYVNQDTLELPRDGVAALEELYRRAAASGLLGHAPVVRVIG